MNSIIQVNIELLKAYALLLESEEKGEPILPALVSIRNAALAGHILLAGQGGRKKVEERANRFTVNFDEVGSYGHRVAVCRYLGEALLNTSFYAIEWSSYLNLVAYASVWMEDLKSKDADDVSLDA